MARAGKLFLDIFATRKKSVEYAQKRAQYGRPYIIARRKRKWQFPYHKF